MFLFFYFSYNKAFSSPLKLLSAQLSSDEICWLFPHCVRFCLVTVCRFIFFFFFFFKDLKPGNLAVNENCELKVFTRKTTTKTNKRCFLRGAGVTEKVFRLHIL